ncbi:serine protease Hayan [Zeugodacus cucurbitae]|uniref:Serine protease snake n=1 Tax=Zeugodacus cucurbitae TaxID=28588 RepID=A0A0A1XD52_ZEUCU|nr:serine protease Hayan [Zeugodacus cucurbitae]
MYFQTVIALLVTTTVLSQVNAQKRYPPAETQKTPNDLFEESVTRIKEGNFEVDIIVRRPNNSSKPGAQQKHGATPNRKVDNGKIIFPNNSEEQASESRRSEFEYNNQEYQRRTEQDFGFEQRRREGQQPQEPRRKYGNELEPDNLYNQNIERNIYNKNVSEPEASNGERLPNSNSSNQQKREGHNRRLCEVKYNEYIEQIFRNDAETSADANDAEFDGRVLATPGEYPHMTALGFQREDNTFDYKCGGSLISDNFVITAAHCTNITSEIPTIARIGDTNLMEAKRFGPQLFGIKTIYAHPQYDGVTYYNDIALLLLNASVEFTEFVRPIRLWTRPYLPLSTAFAMGYGATSFARAPTNRLTDFNLTIVENDDCNQRLPQLDEVPRGIIESQVCAQDFVMQRDTCQGDSGGPLQYNIRGRRRRKRIHYHLIGITSFGLLCRSQNPGVYTRIYSFLDWIESTVWSSYEH